MGLLDSKGFFKNFELLQGILEYLNRWFTIILLITPLSEARTIGKGGGGENSPLHLVYISSKKGNEGWGGRGGGHDDLELTLADQLRGVWYAHLLAKLVRAPAKQWPPEWDRHSRDTKKKYAARTDKHLRLTKIWFQTNPTSFSQSTSIVSPIP